MALFLSPNNALTMGAVDDKLSGVAGSLNSLARTVGLTIGISFGATLLFAQLPGVTRISAQSGAPFSTRTGNSFLVSHFSIGGWLNHCHYPQSAKTTSKRGTDKK